MDSLKIGFLQNDGTGGHQTAQDVRTHSPNPNDEVIRQINAHFMRLSRSLKKKVQQEYSK